MLVVAGASLLCAGGCESWQRKFTRKKKGPVERPTPIINFIDYSSAMTPSERYRKHYLIFDYWNTELSSALSTSLINGKRVRRASTESLNELRALRGILNEELAGRLDPILASREKTDDMIQRGGAQNLANILLSDINTQTRALHREFTWRKVEDRLKPAPAAASAEPAAAAP